MIALLEGEEQRGTHSSQRLSEELEQVNLVRVEGITLLADGVIGIEGRNSTGKMGRESELAELRLEGVGSGLLAHHDGPCSASGS